MDLAKEAYRKTKVLLALAWKNYEANNLRLTDNIFSQFKDASEWRNVAIARGYAHVQKKQPLHSLFISSEHPLSVLQCFEKKTRSFIRLKIITASLDVVQLTCDLIERLNIGICQLSLILRTPYFVRYGSIYNFESLFTQESLGNVSFD